MKILAWGAVLVGSMVAVAACGSSTDGNNGGGGTGGATSSSSSSSSGTASSSSSSSSSGSTSSSSSSGGTGGAPVCGITWDSRADCQTCMDDACCAEQLECASGQPCDAWYQCAVACTTGTCVDGCDTSFAAGRAAYDALSDCWESSCQTDQACMYQACESGLLFTSNFESCATCLGTSCCAQTTACMMDQGCATCATGDPSALPANCTDGSATANLYTAWETCTDASCAKDCTFGICDSGLATQNSECNYCLGQAVAEGGCCETINTCKGKPACLDCLTGNGTNCDQNAEYNAVNTCWGTTCGMACGG